MHTTRRQFLTGVTSLAVSHALFRSRVFAQQQTKPTRIVLLGTKGGPRVGDTGGMNPAPLLMINDVPYVIDCGYGVSKQLISAGVALNRVRYVFITHHHSDHNLEPGPLFYNAWITGFAVRVNAYGPPGWTQMTRDFWVK